MCGIVGFNWKDKKLLNSAMKEIKSRGPDDSGTFSDAKMTLGHNRLSIIDLSKAGKQPMSNEEKNIWIVFNGEIYNHKEIRKNLKKKHKFKSKTDTEVLIHLYEEESFNMLSKLQGMFAFCIYDMKKQILFLARDRVGIKPIYYYKKNKDFMFCSGMNGLIQNRKIKREINLKALNSYLIFRANTEEETFIKDIKKIMPGHMIIYNLRERKAKVKKYWDFSVRNISHNFNQLEKKLKELIEEAVKSRLMSDVPYGVFLSGGVDSGMIAALVNKYSKIKPIKTFSVGFEEDNYSETKEARFIAEKLKTDHKEILIKKDSIKALPEIIYMSGEPIADPTIIPVYFLSKFAKKHCTVILTGEGADEIFAGYPQYKFMKIHNKVIRKFPMISRKFFTQFVQILPQRILSTGFKYASALGRKGLERFSNFVRSNDYSKQYLNQVAIFNEAEQNELLNGNFRLYEKYNKYFTKAPNRIVNACQLIDFKNPMVEDLLMKVDKSTMAFSVEGRVPFLDHRIVELAASLPERTKLRGFTRDKFILRKIAKGLVPNQTMRRKKQHFFVPIDSWLENELSPLIEKFLSKEYLEKQKIFSHSYVKKIKDGFKHSKLFYSRQLWCLIVFQIWYKQYIENEKVKL